MFAPLGYEPLETVLEVCQEAADEYMSDVLGEVDLHSKLGEEAHFGAALLATWLTTWTLNERAVFISSPDGRICRASRLLMFHEDSAHTVSWEWPLRPGGRLHRLLNRAIGERDSSAGLPRFRFVDLATGTIWADHERLSELRHQAVEMDEDVERQCRIAAHFDGWCICFPEEQAYKATADLWRALEAHPTEDNLLPGQRSVAGRPRLQGVARSAYLRVFPNGHSGLPWKEVARLVEEEAGRRISAKTIQRAIGQNADKTD